MYATVTFDYNTIKNELQRVIVGMAPYLYEHLYECDNEKIKRSALDALGDFLYLSLVNNHPGNDVNRVSYVLYDSFRLGHITLPNELVDFMTSLFCSIRDRLGMSIQYAISQIGTKGVLEDINIVPTGTSSVYILVVQFEEYTAEQDSFTAFTLQSNDGDRIPDLVTI